jgi:hypothetical protein
LNTENIIGIKDCFEVFSGQERPLWELIERTALWVVVVRLTLDVLKTLNNIELCIWWAIVKDVSEDFLLSIIKSFISLH